MSEVGEGRPSSAIGVVNSCAAGVEAFTYNVEPLTALKNEELAKAPLNEGLSYIFEAYARHFIYRHTDIRKPQSFIDGFAQYFSSVRFTDTQLVVGRAPRGVGSYLHLIDDGNVYQMTFDEVLELKPIARPDKPAAKLELQARAWNLVHYMLSNEANRDKMTRYLNLVNEGAVPANAFEQAFGLGGKALNTAMWRYRLKGLEVVHVDVPELPQASMNFSSFTSAEGDFVLLGGALRSCPTPAQGASLLAKARAQARPLPNNDLAQLTLSRAEIEFGNPASALDYLSRAARRDSATVETHYLLGLANLKLAERAPADERETRLGAARRSFERAAALKPGEPEVSYGLFRTELLSRSEPAKTGVARAIVAWRHAHEVPVYARSAALAYAWMGDAAGAYRALSILANNQRDPENANWAQAWLGKLSNGVARADLLAAMRKEDGAPRFRQWMTAHEDVMTDVANNAKMEKSRAYLESMTMGDPSKPETMNQRIPNKVSE